MWDQNEPLGRPVHVLSLVIFDGDDDDRPPPDGPPSIRPILKPTPRAMAVRIAAPSSKSLIDAIYDRRQDPFKALSISNISFSIL